MFDDSEAIFERIRFLDGAFVIAILPNKRILMTAQRQPGRPDFISLPGGSLDYKDEDPKVCAERELLEETGYKSDDIHLWLRFDGTNNVMAYTYFYIARDVYKVQDISPDPGEQITLFDMSFDEFVHGVRDIRFHHHWNLIPILYEALLDNTKKEALRREFYGL